MIANFVQCRLTIFTLATLLAIYVCSWPFAYKTLKAQGYAATPYDCDDAMIAYRPVFWAAESPFISDIVLYCSHFAAVEGDFQVTLRVRRGDLSEGGGHALINNVAD